MNFIIWYEVGSQKLLKRYIWLIGGRTKSKFKINPGKAYWTKNFVFLVYSNTTGLQNTTLFRLIILKLPLLLREHSKLSFLLNLNSWVWAQAFYSLFYLSKIHFRRKRNRRNSNYILNSKIHPFFKLPHLWITYSALFASIFTDLNFFMPIA